MNARIEPPFDVGHPWTLHVGTEKCVISEVTAHNLYSLGMAISNDDRHARPIPEAVKQTEAKLSKKARRLLGLDASK